MRKKQPMHAELSDENYKEPWDQFRYGHIETGWFDFDRTKTLKAMYQLWKGISQDDLDRLPSHLTVFAPSTSADGQIFPWCSQGGLPRTEEGAFVYLSPQLETKPQEEVNRVVAHEFAHVVLGHYLVSMPGIELDALPKRHSDSPGEIDADGLIAKWGFAPAYKRSKKGKATGREHRQSRKRSPSRPK